MTRRNPMAEEMARMRGEITDLQRRLENTFRPGKVKQVSGEKRRIRMVIGKNPDGTEQLSPWRPHMQIAGALGIHSMPSEGQQMMLISPNGDLEQGFAVPLTWSNANPSPSDKEDEHVLKFGQVTATLKTDGIEIDAGPAQFHVKTDGVYITIGGVTWKMTGGGEDQDGGTKTHDGLNVGSTHRHDGIKRGGEKTDPPDEA